MLACCGVTSYRVRIGHGNSAVSHPGIRCCVPRTRTSPAPQAHYTYSLAQERRAGAAAWSGAPQEGDAAQYHWGKLASSTSTAPQRAKRSPLRRRPRKLTSASRPRWRRRVSFDPVGQAELPHAHGTAMAVAKNHRGAPPADGHKAPAVSASIDPGLSRGGAKRARKPRRSNNPQGVDWAASKNVNVIPIELLRARAIPTQRTLTLRTRQGDRVDRRLPGCRPESPPRFPCADPTNVIAGDGDRSTTRCVLRAHNRGPLVSRWQRPASDILVPAPRYAYH